MLAAPGALKSLMLKLVECGHILDRAARGKAESKQVARRAALFRRRSAMATGELTGDEEEAIRSELEVRGHGYGISFMRVGYHPGVFFCTHRGAPGDSEVKRAHSHQ